MNQTTNSRKSDKFIFISTIQFTAEFSQKWQYCVVLWNLIKINIQQLNKCDEILFIVYDNWIKYDCNIFLS